MERKALNEYNESELQKTVKSRKTYFMIFAFFFIVVSSISLYNFVQRGEFKAKDVVPLILLPIILNSWNSYKESKRESESRKKQL